MSEGVFMIFNVCNVESLRKRAKNPKKPGCYLMFDNKKIMLKSINFLMSDFMFL